MTYIPYPLENGFLIGNITIEMTKGVTTKHVLEQKDENGETELQEMCFYLENKFQVVLMVFSCPNMGLTTQ